MAVWVFVLVFLFKFELFLGFPTKEETLSTTTPTSEAALTENPIQTEERWPDGRIPFVLDSGFDEEFRRLFYSAVDEFHRRTCVRFYEKEPTDQLFLLIKSDGGCWSYVGMRPEMANKGQPLSLGPDCRNRGIILHELMHSLGFFHEHTRFDRDEHIQINASNIDPEFSGEFVKRKRRESDNSGHYDLNSILHYESTAFASNPSAPTIIPLNSTKTQKMGQRENLSPEDVSKINRLYECENKTNSNSKFHRRSSAFFWFRDSNDFKLRTGQIAPSWLKYASFDAHDYPRSIQCDTTAEANCQDRATDCFELSLRGECERKPGYMLRFCRRSCCNCNDSKCFDTNDERKFQTLCSATFDNGGRRLTSCEHSAIRRNALDYCPRSCGGCFSPDYPLNNQFHSHLNSTT